MKKGALMIARNNGGVDYLKLAIFNAKRIRRIWGMSVAIATDTEFSDDSVECVRLSATEDANRRYYPGIGGLPFLNGDRCNALNLSPFDRTILLDADLIIGTTQIPDLCDGGLKLTREAFLVDGTEPDAGMTTLGVGGIPMVWATVVYFERRDSLSRLFFEAWQNAVRWYTTYSEVYGFAKSPMRNDYAAAVALDQMCNEVGADYSDVKMHYTIPTLNFFSSIEGFDPVRIRLQLGYEATLSTTDIHVLNKPSLMKVVQ